MSDPRRDWLDGLIETLRSPIRRDTAKTMALINAEVKGMYKLADAILAAPPVPLSDRFDAIVREAKELGDLFECKTPGNGGPTPGHCAACCGGTGIEASCQEEFDFAMALNKLAVAGERYAALAAAPEPPTPESES